MPRPPAPPSNFQAMVCVVRAELLGWMFGVSKVRRVVDFPWGTGLRRVVESQEEIGLRRKKKNLPLYPYDPDILWCI